tara:strand:- start:72122 stop:73012 length:891 start_codon:yes stop_codon:yes gene_type:complete
MAEIKCLSYIGLGVSNLDAWQDFAENIIGLQLGRREAGFMTLRMDEHLQRFFLEEDGTDDLLAAGWEFGTEAELESYVARLEQRGISVRPLGSDELAKRHIGKAYSCIDPSGFAHEFFVDHQVAELKNAFRSKVLKGSFLTGDLGIGHILPFCRDREQTVSFYRDDLGLRISDYITEEVQPGMVVNATFFHTRTGRHHSIATAQAPVPRVLNHFMLEFVDMDDVGLAYDRVVEAGIHVALELGHHPNDRAFSFYAQTPSGFNFELGWGGIVIDEERWDIKTYTEMSDWGHRRNPLN